MRSVHRLVEEDTPMTLSDTATAQLWETFRAGSGTGLIREAVELVLQELIEAVEAFRSRPEPRRVPLRLLGRDLPECAQQRRPADVAGHGGGHRDHLGRQP